MITEVTGDPEADEAPFASAESGRGRLPRR